MDFLKYICCNLVVFLFTILFSYGQGKDMYAPVKEKDPLELKGIKFGVNIGRFSDYLFMPERVSYETSFDFNLNHKYYGVLEAGYSEIDLKKDNYNYISDGFFMKLGLDYNMLKKQPTDYLGIGIRLGWADFSQSANNITYDANHWPTSSSSINSENLSTYWLEASLGIKGEIFKNVYFGWSALVKVRVSGAKNLNVQPHDIPGYGGSDKGINLGANYYIFYQIPFNRN